ncbi:hypothetical protein [Microbacterium sp.]|uniref:hypothetical protein n=1 Tax=Microbacterium sp. TaxID=51671 RepID=UPI003A944163
MRTSWFRENGERATVDVMLLEHVNHVLRNGFRAECGGEGLAGSRPPAPDVSAAAMQRDAQLKKQSTERC